MRATSRFSYGLFYLAVSTLQILATETNTKGNSTDPCTQPCTITVDALSSSTPNPELNVFAEDHNLVTQLESLSILTASNSPSQRSVTLENSQPPTLPFAPISTTRTTSIQTKKIESKILPTSNGPSLALTASNLTPNPGSTFTGNGQTVSSSSHIDLKIAVPSSNSILASSGKISPISTTSSSSISLSKSEASFSGPIVSQQTPVPGSTVSIDGETGSPSVSLLGSGSATRIGISSVEPELPISSRPRVTASARTESHAGNQTARQNATAPLEYSGMAAGRRNRWDIVAVMGICAVGVAMRLI